MVTTETIIYYAGMSVYIFIQVLYYIFGIVHKRRVAAHQKVTQSHFDSLHDKIDRIFNSLTPQPTPADGEPVEVNTARYGQPIYDRLNNRIIIHEPM